MVSYIIKRIGISMTTFLLATILIFCIIQLPPGNFVDYQLSQVSSESSEAGQGQLV